MPLSLLKIIKTSSIWAAWLGISLIICIIIFMIYRLIFKPSRIKNKKRWDMKLYFFFKKHHTHIGSLILFLFFYHAIFMVFYVVVRGKEPFPFFGFLTIITFILAILTGIVFYYQLRMNNTTSLQKKKIKLIHLLFVFLGICFFILHYYEVQSPIINIVEQYRKIPK